MNLPLAAIAITLVFFFLHLKVPKDDLRSKMKRMDWIGNFLVIVSITITSVALTWAGVKYSWSSYQVLVPLILGVVLMIVFFVYEATLAVEPVVPWQLVNNRTSALGYFTVFLHGLIVTCVICKPDISEIGQRLTVAPRSLPTCLLPSCEGAKPHSIGDQSFRECIHHRTRCHQ